MNDPPNRLDVVGIVAVPTMLLTVYLAAPYGDLLWLGALAGAASVIGSVPLVVRLVTRVRTSHRPIQVAAEAMALAGSVIAIGFSTIYSVVSQRDPDQFTGLETRLDALYFTITTASTVGFGDITPTGQLARALVTVNIVFNITALALSIRLLSRAAGRRLDEVGRRIDPGAPDAP